MKPVLLATISLGLALLLISPRAAWADGPPREPSVEEIKQARELSYRGEYEEATRRFEAIASKYPRSPAGEFYKAVTLIWRSRVDAKLDAGTRDYDDQIEALLVSMIPKVEAIKAAAGSKDDQVESLYYLGSAAGMRARIALYQNHGIPAAKQARLAQDLFDDLFKLDPNYFDAYYAPGAIYYAVGLLVDSTLAKLVVNMLGQKSLPAGDIARGRTYLTTAAEKAPLNDVDAKLGLVEIYALNENRFDLALPIARDLQAKYPYNQTFARYMLRIYAGLKDKTRLTQTAQQIIALVKEGKPNFGPFVKAEAERYLAEASKM